MNQRYMQILKANTARTDSGATSLPRAEQNPAMFMNEKVTALTKELTKQLPVPPLNRCTRQESPYWFSNEYPKGESSHQLSLVPSFKELSKRTLSPDKLTLALVTGEGGIFTGLPELSSCCHMTLQVDCNPNVLHLTGLLLTGLADAESIAQEKTVLESAIHKFQKEAPWVTRNDTAELQEQYGNYKAGTGETFCFSSDHRLTRFKQSLSCTVHPVYANFFNVQEMQRLTTLLQKSRANIAYLHISNVPQFYFSFYQMNPFSGVIKDVEPSLYVKGLPFTDDALCAYSQLNTYGKAERWTRNCPANELESALYNLALLHRDMVIKRNASRQARLLLRSDSGLFLADEVVLHLARYPLADKTAPLIRLTLARPDKSEFERMKEQCETIHHLIKEHHGEEKKLLAGILNASISEETNQDDNASALDSTTSAKR